MLFFFFSANVYVGWCPSNYQQQHLKKGDFKNRNQLKIIVGSEKIMTKTLIIKLVSIAGGQYLKN